ncbi:MAG: DNA mismatch repair endonuclease MutH [Gammaproteobacteria bacterium]|nr:DNA mismatch repair endonuclease MutH [Gammaproteobacteria bacterium]
MTKDLVLAKAIEMEGLTFSQLGNRLGLPVPTLPLHAKGWLGQTVEKFLGSTAGSLPIPDFPNLNLEIKTIPLGASGKVQESTYITVLPLRAPFELEWRSSACYHKLQQVLWIPIEGDLSIPYSQRRIGRAILWQMSEIHEEMLKSDWELIMDMVIQGQVEKITGSIGTYLHIRPKAANSSILTNSLDAYGQDIQTLPRGFYLRSCFTQKIMEMSIKA